MLGATVPTTGGIEKAFYWGDKWNCQAVQFYITLSRKWQVDKIKEEKVSIFKDAWKESSVKEVIAHVPYLVNLVSENKEIRIKSIKRMVEEIERAKLLGVKYLVLHPGSAKKEGVKLLKESFDRVFQKTNPKGVKILIETMAGQGNYLGSSFEEMGEILYSLNNELFSVCFDTAHVFQSGYDIRDYDETFRKFEKNVPLKKIELFHLNDSRSLFGSNVDRHEHIGKGEIGLTFFKTLLNDKRFKDLPKIIETPEMGEESLNNLKVLRKLIV